MRNRWLVRFFRHRRPAPYEPPQIDAVYARQPVPVVSSKPNAPVFPDASIVRETTVSAVSRRATVRATALVARFTTFVPCGTNALAANEPLRRINP
jgi:hypothetical protein